MTASFGEHQYHNNHQPLCLCRQQQGRRRGRWLKRNKWENPLPTFFNKLSEKNYTETMHANFEIWRRRPKVFFLMSCTYRIADLSIWVVLMLLGGLKNNNRAGLCKIELVNEQWTVKNIKLVSRQRSRADRPTLSFESWFWTGGIHVWEGRPSCLPGWGGGTAGPCGPGAPGGPGGAAGLVFLDGGAAGEAPAEVGLSLLGWKRRDIHNNNHLPSYLHTRISRHI